VAIAEGLVFADELVLAGEPPDMITDLEYETGWPVARNRRGRVVQQMK
jgi:hypothetical protein